MRGVDLCVCYRSVYSFGGKSLGVAIDKRPFITRRSTFGLLVPVPTLDLTCRVVRIQPGTVRKRRRRRRRRRLLLGCSEKEGFRGQSRAGTRKEDEGHRAPPLSQSFLPPRYVELVNAACNFEPHDSFFSLFSDPRSTRLTRIHLREDLVQDQDLEAIRKQVRPASPGTRDGRGRLAPRQSNRESGRVARLQGKNPKAPLVLPPITWTPPQAHL